MFARGPFLISYDSFHDIWFARRFFVVELRFFAGASRGTLHNWLQPPPEDAFSHASKSVLNSHCHENNLQEFLQSIAIDFSQPTICN